MTVVAAGSVRGVAVATGTDPELGRISTLLGDVEPLETPLTRDLARFGRAITAAIGVAAVVLAGIAALRAAIEEGRRAYDNPFKALAFVLPTSIGQALIVAVAVLAFPAGDMPVSPVQILWINLIVAVALVLPLAFGAPEPDVMSRPPRPPGTPWLDRPLPARALQAVFVFAPFMQSVFGSAALGIREPAWATAAAIVILPIAGAEEFRRRLVRRCATGS